MPFDGSTSKHDWTGYVPFDEMPYLYNPEKGYISNGSNKTIEVHFFEFNNDLYQQTLSIEILSKIREEQKFDSVEELRNQLKKDKKNSTALFDSERSNGKA